MNGEHDLQHLIDDWHRRAQQVQDAHYDSGLYYERFFLGLGIPVIVLSAFTGGTEVLGYMPETVGGVISLCIAVLAGLQTFLKYSQRAERHRIAGARYGGIRRDLEEIECQLSMLGDQAFERVHQVKNRMDSLATECPEIPHRILARYRPDNHDR